MPREQNDSACMMLTKNVHRIYCCTMVTSLGVNEICCAVTRAAQSGNANIMFTGTNIILLYLFSFFLLQYCIMINVLV